MPVDWSKYPDDWDDIATAVKVAADWKCEQCGLQCRQPGEQFDTHKRTLTVAHINHTESDCRDENLIALCSGCHLRYDAPMRALKRIVRKRGKQ
jgi:5-methylcytosine-specific restriction endonuclease McrA